MAASAKHGHGDESKQNQIVVQEVLNMSSLISIILKTVGLFSLLFPVFGPNFSRLAVQYGLGSRWYKEETVTSLAVYCLYILVLGMNGVSEAFVYATSSAGVVSTVNISLVTSSAVFCLSSVALIARIGTSGILVANILSMSVRIVFNLFYIQQYFNSIPELFPSKLISASNKNVLIPLRDACIHTLDVGGMVLVFGITYVSSTRYASSLMTVKDALLHLSVGAGCFLLLVVFFYKFHKDEIFKMFSTLREYKSDKKIN
jgi:oligosaccharide translocation protein RFT1